MLYLERVSDPEIPAVSIVDLGMVRGIEIDGEEVTVIVTPTYTGCPAIEQINSDIESELKKQGIVNVVIKQSFSVPWTSDWISEKGKKALTACGIAPPEGGCPQDRNLVLFPDKSNIKCPRCNRNNTNCVSEAASTACKSLYYCEGCREPFEYFKRH